MNNKYDEEIDNKYNEDNINIDELEDFHLLELQKRIIELKKDRKQQAKNAEYLKNRINLLNKEEEKVRVY